MTELRPEDYVQFVPSHGDNRELPEEEQCVITLCPMTGGEFRAYTRSVNSKKNNLEKVVERIVRDRVKSIQNYDDIRGNAITDGQALFDRGEVSFVDEVFQALTEISVLKEGLRKK
tara:strand:+ start:28320 stop:28667 length:348 start_codon:yes stop_codon:yes gene_type:complete